MTSFAIPNPAPYSGCTDPASDEERPIASFEALLDAGWWPVVGGPRVPLVVVGFSIGKPPPFLRRFVADAIERLHLRSPA